MTRRTLKKNLFFSVYNTSFCEWLKDFSFKEIFLAVFMTGLLNIHATDEYLRVSRAKIAQPHCNWRSFRQKPNPFLHFRKPQWKCSFKILNFNAVSKVYFQSNVWPHKYTRFTTKTSKHHFSEQFFCIRVKSWSS